MSLPRGVVGWSVVCVSSSQGLWVCLWSLHLHRGGLWVDQLSVSLSRVVLGWSVSLPDLGCGFVCVSSLRGCGLVSGLYLFLTRVVGWSVSLPRGVLGWSVSLPRGIVGWSVSPPRWVVGWSVSLPHGGCESLVCVLSSQGLWVGLLSLYFPSWIVGWSFVCVSTSLGCGLVYGLRLFSWRALWVGLWCMSLPRGYVGWSVVCVITTWGYRLYCDLCLFFAGVVGWSVVCVSSSGG